MLKGLLIKECLKNESILESIKITKTETWDITNGTGWQPKKWTAISFEGEKAKADSIADELAKVMKPKWYANFSTEEVVYVIFENRVFTYPKGNEIMRQMIREYAVEKGIPDTQVDWDE